MSYNGFRDEEFDVAILFSDYLQWEGLVDGHLAERRLS